MPNRIVRDGILTSLPVAGLNWAEEVFYRRIMSVADDFGRYHAHASLLRAACYPLHLMKVSDSDIEKWLAACVAAALVRVYPAQDGNRYLEIIKFGQQVRAVKSKYPEPLATDITCDQVLADAHLDVSVSEDVSVAPKAPGIELPSWLPLSLWSDFKANRKALKKPMTPLAESRMLSNFEKLRADGVDVLAAIDTAIRSGWSDVYAPKAGTQSANREPAALPRLRS